MEGETYCCQPRILCWTRNRVFLVAVSADIAYIPNCWMVGMLADGLPGKEHLHEGFQHDDGTLATRASEIGDVRLHGTAN